jgi:hypothetical protein
MRTFSKNYCCNKALEYFSKILLVCMLAIPQTAPLLAATATSTVGATLLGSISSSTLQNLQFGELTAGPIAGTVLLTANGVRSSTGGVSLSLTGTSSPATFTLTGNPNATYAITLPVSVTITDGTGNSMTVDGFLSLPAATGQLSATGQQTLAVGGRLNVPANQVMGAYSGILLVMIVYN